MRVSLRVPKRVPRRGLSQVQGLSSLFMSCCRTYGVAGLGQVWGCSVVNSLLGGGVVLAPLKGFEVWPAAHKP